MVSSHLRRLHSPLMQILKRIGLILIWLAGPVFVFAAANKNDPYLISLRGAGKHRSGRGEHHCRGYPDPSRLLATGDRRKVAHSAVVPAVAVDARRACFVRVAQAKRSANRRRAGTKPWPAFHRRILVIPRSGRAGREGADFRRLHHQAQYRGIDGGEAERRNLGASGQAARRRSATPDRRRRPGRRHRIASGAALDQAAGAIDAGEPCAGCSRREGGGVRAYPRAGAGGARRQPEPGAGAGSATGIEAQPVRFQHADRSARDFR